MACFFMPKMINCMIHLYYQPNFVDQVTQLKESLLTHNIEHTAKFNHKFLKSIPSQQPSLLLDEKGLWLAYNHDNQPIKIQPNWFAQQKRVVNAGKKSELLLKACKINQGMTVIDATAGMGHDSILLAGRGALVTMVEAQVLVHALLENAMSIIANNQNWQALHNRLTLLQANAIDYFQDLQAQHIKVDLVYLDPMFPHDSYKSALVNKNMQALQLLAQPPTLADEITLLENALKVSDRVIVKRPHDAPFFAQQETSTQWMGDVIRYDAYLNN